MTSHSAHTRRRLFHSLLTRIKGVSEKHRVRLSATIAFALLALQTPAHAEKVSTTALPLSIQGIDAVHYTDISSLGVAVGVGRTAAGGPAGVRASTRGTEVFTELPGETNGDPWYAVVLDDGTAVFVTEAPRVKDPVFWIIRFTPEGIRHEALIAMPGGSLAGWNQLNADHLGNIYFSFFIGNSPSSPTGKVFRHLRLDRANNLAEASSKVNPYELMAVSPQGLLGFGGRNLATKADEYIIYEFSLGVIESLSANVVALGDQHSWITKGARGTALVRRNILGHGTPGSVNATVSAAGRAAIFANSGAQRFAALADGKLLFAAQNKLHVSFLAKSGKKLATCFIPPTSRKEKSTAVISAEGGFALIERAPNAKSATVQPYIVKLPSKLSVGRRGKCAG